MSADPFAALVAQGQRKLAAAAPAGALVPLPPETSPTHAAVAGIVEEVLGLIDRLAVHAPAPLRALTGIIKGSRGMMLDGLLSMPDEQLVGMLRTVRDRVESVPGVAGR